MSSPAILVFEEIQFEEFRRNKVNAAFLQNRALVVITRAGVVDGYNMKGDLRIYRVHISYVLHKRFASLDLINKSVWEVFNEEDDFTTMVLKNEDAPSDAISEVFNIIPITMPDGFLYDNSSWRQWILERVETVLVDCNVSLEILIN